MHYDYVVILKRENARKTDLVSVLLLIFSIISFCYTQIRNGFNGFLTISVIFLFLGILVNIYSFRKKKEMQFRNWLLAAALFWLGMPYFQWMFLPFLIFAILEAQAKYPLEIGFYSEGIVLNSLFKKKFPWSSFHSVILKDGLLTLDFKDNKLIQKEVLDDDEPDAPEDEFNDYCQSKLVNLQ
jgi:drug/metabolite transporter (DMT)-like permease